MPVYRIAATIELEVFAEHAEEDQAVEAVERLLGERRGSGVVPGSFRIEDVCEIDPDELPADAKILTFLKT